MRQLVHLSDLHFGRDRPELLNPLIARVNALEPDLVAISGDLTQRARHSQFEAAREFIEQLHAPVLVVPGNHDVPLENLLSRAIWPWRRYRRWITRDLNPQFSDDEMIVLGVNTVNPSAHQSGWFTHSAVARVAKAFADPEDQRTRIIVAHHPLEHQPGDHKTTMRGANRALEELARLKTDVVLSGHLHTWRAAPFAEKAGRHAILQVHAGTGLSTRQRGEENDFNLLKISAGTIDVIRYAVTAGSADFMIAQTLRFISRPQGWVEEQTPPMAEHSP
ncbi:MAG: metallophosphoesterase family protein [Rhodobacterales bacterium]|nr:metallophosphoesterase family protein [Rhodobacterales bacterium]